jgi:sugar phosphate isomerase/epimerase
LIKGLASTGLVNRFPDAAPPEALVAWCPRLAVEGFELSIGRAWDLDRVEQELGEAGLRFPAAHADKGIGAELLDDPPAALGALERNCTLAAALGAELLVLHLWELPIGDRRLEENLKLLPDCLDIAEASGLTLAVETIPCSVGSPLANVHRALDADDRCEVTIDTEFLAHHGQVAEALADDALWTRVAHVHVKDFAGGRLHDEDRRRRYLIPGEGEIDFDAVFAALAARGYDRSLTLEVSAVTAEGRIDERRLRQAESWLAQRPWRLDGRSRRAG